MKQIPLWTPFASVLLAIAWLLPNASPPWVAFHKDAWCAAVFMILAIVLSFGLVRSGAQTLFSLDALSAGLVLLAVMPALQWKVGIIYFSGHAVVGFGYFFAAALAGVIGRAWERRDPGKPGDFIFLALLIAAIGTSGLMLAQWVRLESNDIWINSLPVGGRPYGNLLQPNNAATLLLLGMVSLFWFASQLRIGKLICSVGLGYLLFFVVLTGSRSGYLSFLVVALLGLFMGRRHDQFKAWNGVFWLLICLLPVFMYVVTRDWGEAAFGQQPFERNLTSARIVLYRAYLDAAWASPWLGYGFEQGAATQLASGALGHQLPGLFTWAHNAFLDLATWFGLPVALLAIGVVILSVTELVRSPFDMRRSIYFGGICVVFLHGMVELPLAYAYFLLPASFMAGSMLASTHIYSLSIPRIGVRASVAGMCVLLGVIIYDYLQIESAFTTWRFKQANIGSNHAMDIPKTLLLNQSEALLVGLRGTPSSMTDASLRDFEKATLLAPSASALQQLAELQLGRGDIVAAQNTANVAHQLTQLKDRKALSARWRYLGTQDQSFRSVEWPE